MTCMHARVHVIVFGVRKGTYVCMHVYDMPMYIFATSCACTYTAQDVTLHGKVLVIVHLCLEGGRV